MALVVHDVERLALMSLCAIAFAIVVLPAPDGDERIKRMPSDLIFIIKILTNLKWNHS
jgi:hypothetical protein